MSKAATPSGRGCFQCLKLRHDSNPFPTYESMVKYLLGKLEAPSEALTRMTINPAFNRMQNVKAFKLEIWHRRLRSRPEAGS